LERLYVYTSLQSSSRIGIHNVEVDHFIENTETSKYPTAKEYYVWNCLDDPGSSPHEYDAVKELLF